jgi:hypothetical protein
MDNNKELTKTPYSQTLQRVSQEVEPISNNTTEISVYHGQAPASRQDIAIEIAKLSSVFPKNDNPLFYNVLAEEIDDSGMSAQKLHDAVKYVIRHNSYKSFSIADIFSYDKRIKFYTFEELYRKYQQFPHPHICQVELFTPTENIYKFCLLADALQYGLKISRRYDL